MKKTVSYTIRGTADDGGVAHKTVQSSYHEAEGKAALFEELAGNGKLVAVELKDCDLNDADGEAIAAIVKGNPNLSKLVLLKNFIGPETIEKIADASQEHGPLQWVNLSRNMLKDEAGAKAIGALLRSNPRMTHLNVSSNQLKDAGSQLLTEHIASAPLQELYAAHLNNSDAGYQALVQTVGDHPTLMTVNIMQGERVIDNESRTSVITNSLSRGSSSSLISFTPQSDDSKTMCDENKDAARHAKTLLEERDATTLDYHELAAICEHLPYIHKNLSRTAAQDSEKSPAQQAEEFTTLLRSLPPLPSAEEAVDALFTPDKNGYAPLDNPLLWRDAEAVFDFLDAHDQPLDEAFLARTTPKGMGVIESALGFGAAAQTVPLLNAHNARIQKDVLLDAEHNPTELYQGLLSRRESAALFTAENWKGANAADMRAAAEHLSAGQQQRVGVHRLAAAIRQENAVQNTVCR